MSSVGSDWSERPASERRFPSPCLPGSLLRLQVVKHIAARWWMSAGDSKSRAAPPSAQRPAPRLGLMWELPSLSCGVHRRSPYLGRPRSYENRPLTLGCSHFPPIRHVRTPPGAPRKGPRGRIPLTAAGVLPAVSHADAAGAYGLLYPDGILEIIPRRGSSQGGSVRWGGRPDRRSWSLPFQGDGAEPRFPAEGGSS